MNQEICIECGKPVSEHGGQVGDTTYSVPCSTDGLAYGVFANQFKAQYEALLKSLQDRYNLKRAYAGLPKQLVRFQFHLLEYGTAGSNKTPHDTDTVSGSASLFLRARGNIKDSYSEAIYGPSFFAYGALRTNARNDALPVPDLSKVQWTIQTYEGIASLATSQEGGSNPFSVALPAQVACGTERGMQAGYYACLKSIADVLRRRMTVLEQVQVELLGLVEAQVNIEKQDTLKVTTGPGGLQPGPTASATTLSTASPATRKFVVRKH